MLQVFKTLLDRDTPKLESAMNKEKQNVARSMFIFKHF